MNTPSMNSHITSQKPLIYPSTLRKNIVATAKNISDVQNHRQEFVNILNGEDPRFILQIGPCSIHDPVAAMEYAKRLVVLSTQCADKIKIVMRVFFEKPRTTVGWKGLICEPDINGMQDFHKGLHISRDLLRKITDLGLAASTEFLDPLTPQYISDLITSGTIGARTIESQTHRQMASGLSMPIGYKNSTTGSIIKALEAMIAGNTKGSFLGVNDRGQICIFETKGNPNRYLILRGGSNGINYDSVSVQDTIQQIDSFDPKLTGSNIIIDCSHGNSGKKHVNQGTAFNAVIDQRVSGNTRIKGLMLESNLAEGRQNDSARPLLYGVSITDECIGWAETEELVLSAYSRL